MSYKTGKRILDIIISLAFLPFFVVIFPVAAILIKVGDGGPIFYCARRVSQGRTVLIYKFRTMILGAEKRKRELMDKNERSDGPFFKIAKDPRVTRTGRILRKFWIDEMPQIFNVLRGDISFVGPRPYEEEEVEKYPEEYRFLKREKAGITGLSQINGSSNLSFKKVLEYDAYYAKNKSLLLDLKIIWKTFLLLFNPSGV